MTLLASALDRKPITANQGAHKLLIEINKTRPFNTNFNLVLPHCFCGIEIEVEGLDAQLNLTGIWTAKPDNSLRKGGVEYISYPVCGRDLIWNLELFFRHLPIDAQFSPRTSIHVHVNVLDMELEQIEQFIVLYLLFEKVLYRWIGKDRDRNIFCVPLQDTYRVCRMMVDVNRALSRCENVEYEEARYAGLNLACLYKFGTFEFRQLGGTRSIDTVLTWINMLQSLKAYAFKGFERQEIMDLNTTSDYRSFLFRVFGEITSRFDLSTIDKDMERGVTAIKHSLLTNVFYNEVRTARSVDSPVYKYLGSCPKPAEVEELIAPFVIYNAALRNFVFQPQEVR